MGFLNNLFGRDDVDKCIAKAKKYAEKQDLGEALNYIKRAEKVAKDDEKSKVTSAKAEIERIAYDLAFEQAKEYLRAHMHQNAQNAIDRALRFAHTEEERENVRQLVDSDLFKDDGEVAAEIDETPHVEGEEHVTGMELEDKWSLYATPQSLPLVRMQHFEALGNGFKKAWIDLQEGHFDEAISGFEAVYAEHKDDPDVLIELGRAYFGKGNLEKAESLVSEANNIKNDDVDTKLLLAQILWGQRKFEKAEEILQQAYDLAPDNNNVLAAVAQQGLMTHELESGIAAVEQLMENVPKDLSVQRLAARLYLENDQDEKALECFETINRLYWNVDPRTKKITFDKNAAAAAASIYFKRGEKLERAVELLDTVRASTEGEEHVAICMQLSEVYDKMGKASKRDEVLTEALRFLDDTYESSKDDKRMNVCFQYADICNRLGKKEMGADKFEEASKFLDSVYQNTEGERRVNLAMQYAEICEKCGVKERADEKMHEARDIVSEAASTGNPLAKLALEMIEKRINGEEMPSPQEFAKKQMEIIESLRQNQMAREAQNASFPEDAYAADDEEAPAQNVKVAKPTQLDNKSADALLRSFASLAPQQPSIAETTEITDDGDESDEAADSESSENNDENK